MSSSEQRNKTVNKQVRMTPEEYDEIQSKASAFGLSFPQYMRDCAMDRPIRSKVDFLAVRELSQTRADLGRLGGLLKLWLTGEHRSAHGFNGDIRELMEQIRGAQDAIQDAIAKVADVAEDSPGERRGRK